jgi:hypothetical protein
VTEEKKKNKKITKPILKLGPSYGSPSNKIEHHGGVIGSGIIMGGSYIAHFTNVSMRFTTSGGLFRAAYYGALAAEQLTIMRN